MTLPKLRAAPLRPEELRSKVDQPGYWTLYDCLAGPGWYIVKACPPKEHPIKRFDRDVTKLLAWSRELAVPVYKTPAPSAVQAIGRTHTWAFQRGLFLALWGSALAFKMPSE